MKEVSNQQYTIDQTGFIFKHLKKKNADYRVFTSPMIDNVYHKEYCFTDGAVFCERIEIIEECFEVERHGILVEVKATFQQVEYWSTDDSVSKYTYF